MGDWYTIGLAAGLGVAIGILAAGFFPRRCVAPVLAALVGLGIGLLVENWQEALAGFLGGFLGGLGATPIVRGALRRGGTRGGVAALVGGRGGDRGRARVRARSSATSMAVVLPVFGLRTRSREPERHAGLRTLARD